MKLDPIRLDLATLRRIWSGARASLDDASMQRVAEAAASVGPSALVLGLVLLVGAFDYLIFSNIDKIAKRINPTSLVVSEIVFGVLLTAVAVQLFVLGLRLLGILAPTVAAH